MTRNYNCQKFIQTSALKLASAFTTTRKKATFPQQLWKDFPCNYPQIRWNRAKINPLANYSRNFTNTKPVRVPTVCPRVCKTNLIRSFEDPSWNKRWGLPGELALEIRRSCEIALGEELIKWFGEVDVARVSRWTVNETQPHTQPP